MNKITNTTRGDIGLQPGVIIPAGGSLDVSSKVLEAVRDLPSVAAHFDGGRLVHAGGHVTGGGGLVGERPSPAILPRKAIIADIIRGLDKDADFTKGGKPEVDAINAVAKWDDPVTAAERDAVWKGMSS